MTLNVVPVSTATSLLAGCVVIVGATSAGWTVRVKLCVAFGVAPFDAVTVNVNGRETSPPHSRLDRPDLSNTVLDMKTASIRTMQHELAALIAEVEKGGEIVITRRNRPVARLGPIASSANPAPGTPGTIRRYWRQRPLPPAVRSSVTNAELIADSRGEV